MLCHPACALVVTSTRLQPSPFPAPQPTVRPSDTHLPGIIAVPLSIFYSILLKARSADRASSPTMSLQQWHWTALARRQATRTSSKPAFAIQYPPFTGRVSPALRQPVSACISCLSFCTWMAAQNPSMRGLQGRSGILPPVH